MKKIIVILLVVIAIFAVSLVVIKNKDYQKEEELKETEGVYVVPTMQDLIANDSSYCVTFQLVWNDMKNEVIKQDIVFTPQLTFAENLNKEEFDETMISSEYYFKIYGLKTLELKEKIEKGIKEKFNEESDILEDFDWSSDSLDKGDASRYFFYTMLYRKFDFLYEFDVLEKGKFNNYENVYYFGIDKNTKNETRRQIEVLYYNSQDDFAILVNTKTNDEVIYVKSPEGNTFSKIYENMKKKESSYEDSRTFRDIDEFKAPKLNLNIKKVYKEFENKPFLAKDGDVCEIAKAIQTIKFKIDEKGGEIKSEAAIDLIKNTSIGPVKTPTPRYFYVDSTFVIFLREKGKQLPYFAARIDDITKY